MNIVLHTIRAGCDDESHTTERAGVLSHRHSRGALDADLVAAAIERCQWNREKTDTTLVFVGHVFRGVGPTEVRMYYVEKIWSDVSLS